MSVYRKTKTGQLVKIAGAITQRLVDQIFEAVYSIDGQTEVYDITQSAQAYLSSISSYQKFSIYCDTPNLYTNVYIKYKDQYVTVYDESTNTSAKAGQMDGKVDLYTKSIFPNTTQYAYISSVDTTNIVTISDTQTIDGFKSYTNGLRSIKTYSDSISTIDLNNQNSYFSVVVDKYGDNNNVIQQTSMYVDNVESSMNMFGSDTTDSPDGVVLVNDCLKNNKHISSVMYVDNIDTSQMTTNSLSLIEQTKDKVELSYSKDTDIVGETPIAYSFKLNNTGIKGEYTNDIITNDLSITDDRVQIRAMYVDEDTEFSYVSSFDQVYYGTMLSNTYNNTYLNNDNEEIVESQQSVNMVGPSMNGAISMSAIVNSTTHDREDIEVMNTISADTIVLSSTSTKVQGGVTTVNTNDITIDNSGVFINGRNADTFATKTIIADYTLLAANWTNKTYTLAVTGKTTANHARFTHSNTGSDNDVLTNIQALSTANIYKMVDNGTSLTFTCETTPSSDLKIQVEVFE